MQFPVTRRHFLYGAGAALAAGARAQAVQTPPKVREFRRGGMVYRRLGSTDLDVSLLSFGSHTDPADRVKAPNGTVLTAQGQARRDRVIAKAFDLGVNLLDVYVSEGQIEPAARSVRGRRDKVLVSLAHDIAPASIDSNCKLFGHIDLHRFHTAEIDGGTLEGWDILRKAKEAGKIRAIGIATHIERTMMAALTELEGLDFIFFPYNFIHARADYSQFLPEAVKRGVGLIAMKPVAAGSLVNLDPKAHDGARPEDEGIAVWQAGRKAVLPQAVAELTKSLDRLPEETLCMAAMRFVYSRPFITAAVTGMFDERWVDDNYAALGRYQQDNNDLHAVIKAAREVAQLRGGGWLPAHYRWLEEQWRAG